jgi:hypothetical protein
MRIGYRCGAEHPVWGRCALVGRHGALRSGRFDPSAAHAAAVTMTDRIVIQRWDDRGSDWPDSRLGPVELPWATRAASDSAEKKPAAIDC